MSGAETRWANADQGGGTVSNEKDVNLSTRPPPRFGQCPTVGASDSRAYVNVCVSRTTVAGCVDPPHPSNNQCVSQNPVTVSV